MLSTFPATPFPGSSFEPGFSPWEHHEPCFFLSPPPLLRDDPVFFNPQHSHQPVCSGSENPSPISSPGSSQPGKTTNPSSGSDEIDRINSEKLGSGFGATSRLGPVIDERKQRRMKSNRESAKRSRIRKQKHMDDLMDQGNRFKVANQELVNRLRLVAHQTQLFCADNEYLRSEAVLLRRRLWNIRQVLLARRHILNTPCINDQGLSPLHSLIT